MSQRKFTGPVRLEMGRRQKNIIRETFFTVYSLLPNNARGQGKGQRWFGF
jgi:hypothetical protein